MGEEDVITKDSPNKEDTEWNGHAQSQSVTAITYIDQDITRFQHRLNVALIELVEYPDQNALSEIQETCTKRKGYGNSSSHHFKC